MTSLSSSIETSRYALLDSYGNLIKQAKVVDRSRITSEGLYESVYVENLIHHAQSLTKVIAEIRLSLVLDDHKGMQEEVKREKEKYKESVNKRKEEIKETLKDLKMDFTEINSINLI